MITVKSHNMTIMALVTVYQLFHASYSTFVSIYVAIDTLKTEPAWIQLIFLQLFRKVNLRYFQLDFLFAKLDFSFYSLWFGSEVINSRKEPYQRYINNYQLLKSLPLPLVLFLAPQSVSPLVRRDHHLQRVQHQFHSAIQ